MELHNNKELKAMQMDNNRISFSLAT